MEKITLEICTGTTCYLLGSAELLEVLENLPAHLADHIEVKGVACQGFCRAGAKPPFIRMNGIVMGEMTSARLLTSLENTLGGDKC